MNKSVIKLVAPLTALSALAVYYVLLPSIPPATADELAQVAIGMVKGKQKDLAKDELTEALARDANNHRANYVSGMLALDEGSYKLAVQHLSAALDAKADDCDAALSLGVAYQNLKEYAKAQALYETVAKIQPNNSKVFYNMGMLYIEVLQYARAQRALETYLKLSPNAEDATFVKQKLAQIDYRIKNRKAL